MDVYLKRFLRYFGFAVIAWFLTAVTITVALDAYWYESHGNCNGCFLLEGWYER